MLHINFQITYWPEIWTLKIHRDHLFIANITKWILLSLESSHMSFTAHSFNTVWICFYIANHRKLPNKKPPYINVHIKICCCLHSYWTSEFIWVTISIYNNRDLFLLRMQRFQKQNITTMAFVKSSAQRDSIKLLIQKAMYSVLAAKIYFTSPR